MRMALSDNNLVTPTSSVRKFSRGVKYGTRMAGEHIEDAFVNAPAHALNIVQAVISAPVETTRMGGQLASKTRAALRILNPLPPTHMAYHLSERLVNFVNDLRDSEIKRPHDSRRALTAYIQHARIPYWWSRWRGHLAEQWKDPCIDKERSLRIWGRDREAWMKEIGYGLEMKGKHPRQVDSPFMLPAPGFATTLLDPNRDHHSWGSIGDVLTTLLTLVKTLHETSQTDSWQITDSDGLDVGYGSWVLNHNFEPVVVATTRPPRTVGWRQIRALSSRRITGPGARATTNVHRLQEQLYDVCRKTNTRAFILSTQKYYVLGQFDDDYTASRVSLPFKYSDPDLLQHMLVFLLRAVRQSDRRHGIVCQEDAVIGAGSRWRRQDNASGSISHSRSRVRFAGNGSRDAGSNGPVIEHTSGLANGHHANSHAQANDHTSGQAKGPANPRSPRKPHTNPLNPSPLRATQSAPTPSHSLRTQQRPAREPPAAQDSRRKQTVLDDTPSHSKKSHCKIQKRSTSDDLHRRTSRCNCWDCECRPTCRCGT